MIRLLLLFAHGLVCPPPARQRYEARGWVAYPLRAEGPRNRRLA